MRISRWMSWLLVLEKLSVASQACVGWGGRRERERGTRGTSDAPSAARDECAPAGATDRFKVVRLLDVVARQVQKRLEGQKSTMDASIGKRERGRREERRERPAARALQVHARLGASSNIPFVLLLNEALLDALVDFGIQRTILPKFQTRPERLRAGRAHVGLRKGGGGDENED